MAMAVLRFPLDGPVPAQLAKKLVKNAMAKHKAGECLAREERRCDMKYLVIARWHPICLQDVRGAKA